ncbi:MAG: hypothetical protein ACXADH_16865 [Candidatus Kariarchaeaceae archaeon]|jgi:hypothetical protein
MADHQLVVQLTELQTKLVQENMLSVIEKKLFWRLVGQIKRMKNPPNEAIVIASNIREILHVERFGNPVPLSGILPQCLLSAILLFLGFLIIGEDEDNLLLGAVIMYFGYIVLFTLYLWVLDLLLISLRFTIGALIISSIIEVSILYVYFEGFLSWLVYYSGLGVIPTMYVFGRWFGGKITGIELVGGIRDKYYLITLKTDYQSYLLASPHKRHWFFIIAGSGTAIVGLLVSMVEILLFQEYFFLVFTGVLIIAETLDYIIGGGKLAGEFGHARRERIIINDIKKAQQLS